MLKITSICLLIFLLGFTSHAQQQVSNTSPLFLVDNMRSAQPLFFISPDKIESMNVLTDSASTGSYGALGKNGVVLIKTKPGAVLMRVKDVIAAFQLPQSARNLKLLINNVPIKTPNLVMIERSELINVEEIACPAPPEGVEVNYSAGEKCVSITVRQPKQPDTKVEQ